MHQGLRRHLHTTHCRHLVRVPLSGYRPAPPPCDLRPIHIDILRGIKQLRQYDLIVRHHTIPVHVNADTSTVARHLRYLRKQGLATHDTLHGYDLTAEGYKLVS